MDRTCSTLPAHSGWHGEWAGFFAFLRHPRLPLRPRGIGWAGLRSTLYLLPLTLLLASAGLFATNLLSYAAPQMPDNRLLDLPLRSLAIYAILIAPVIEETAFRSWLSGRPGQLAFIGVAATGGLLAYAILPDGGPRLAAIVGTIFASGIAWALLHERPPIGLFRRHFGWFYAASTGAFALLHIVNQSQPSGWFSVVLVLPQLLIGLVLGYTRVANGLWSSMLLHAGSNGVVIALVAGLSAYSA